MIPLNDPFITHLRSYFTANSSNCKEALARRSCRIIFRVTAKDSVHFTPTTSRTTGSLLKNTNKNSEISLFSQSFYSFNELITLYRVVTLLKRVEMTREHPL